MKYGRLTVSTKMISISAALLFFMLTPAVSHSIEKCDDTTKAFETVEDLIQIPVDSTWTHELLPTQCIESSMDLMDALVKASSKFKPYAYCKDNSSKPEKSRIPLCRSEKLVSKIQLQFQMVMDCLDIPSKAIFPLINVESGFYPNASAPGGEDTGIGQVTPIAAEDVELRWDWLEAHIQASDKPSCKNLLPHLPVLRLQEIDSSFVCKMLDPVVNPLRNTLYTGYIFLLNTKYYRDYFLENNVNNRLSFLIGRQMSASEVDDVIHLLSIMTYNMGFQWTRDKFAKYLETEEAKANMQSEDFNLLSEQITALENRIQEAKKEMKFDEVALLRIELQTKREEFDGFLKAKVTKTIPIETFYYRNFDKNSLIGFLKKEDSSRYIELVIKRNDAIEKKLGEGTCSEFNNIRQSSALDHMKWHP